jgi:hypothetical protein
MKIAYGNFRMEKSGKTIRYSGIISAKGRALLRP